MIDLNKAIRTPLKGNTWVGTTGLACVWGLLLVTIPALVGARIEYTRNVAAGKESLPGWDDFGQKWIDGIIVMLAWLAWQIPVAILGSISAVAFIPGIGVIVAAWASAGASDSLASTVLGLGGFLLFLVGALIYIVITVAIPLAVYLLWPAAMVNYAMRQRLSALFAIGDIVSLVRSRTGYWAAWLYSLIIGVGVYFVTSLAVGTFIGSVVTFGIVYLGGVMNGHIFGQWAAKAFCVDSASAMPSAFPVPPAPAPPPFPAPVIQEPLMTPHPVPPEHILPESPTL